MLLRDLSPHATSRAAAAPAHEAGALPLLSHALLTTWARSQGSQLTVADYQASGGIQHAIAHTADEVYGALDPAGQEVARRLFLRLVRVADDEPETRSAVRLSELHDWAGPGGPPGDVLAQFVAARLITVDSGTARISHDALLTAWPQLRGWIDANRDGLRTRRRIDDAARAWDKARRDPAALLRGGQLTVARDWAADPVNAASLTSLTQQFLAAASAAEKQQHDAERRHTRLLRRLVAALAVPVVVTVGLPATRSRSARQRVRPDSAPAPPGTWPSPAKRLSRPTRPAPRIRRWPRSSAWPPTGSRPPQRHGPACSNQPAAPRRPG